MKNEWHFYIVRCKDGSLYSGITNDLSKRIEKHNTGKGAKYTSIHRPVSLVYSERCGNVSLARIREEQVKGWTKAKKEDMILGFPRLRMHKQCKLRSE